MKKFLLLVVILALGGWFYAHMTLVTWRHDIEDLFEKNREIGHSIPEPDPNMSAEAAFKGAAQAQEGIHQMQENNRMIQFSLEHKPFGLPLTDVEDHMLTKIKETNAKYGGQ